MPNYRRVWVPGGAYFFMINLLQRDCGVLMEHIATLRAAFRGANRSLPVGWQSASAVSGSDAAGSD